jgi:hypothetical protein
MTFAQAAILKRKAGFVLKWPADFEREESVYESRQEASEAYFVQLAWDYLGSAIRDNSTEEKVALGKAIEESGVDEAGEIIWDDESEA